MRKSSARTTGPSRSRPTRCGHYVKCVYLYYSHRAAEAIDDADAGLAINPNFANLLGVRGVANLFDGRFEQARSDILQSQRLSPRDPLKAISTKYLGDAELGLGQFDAAIDDYHRAIDLGFNSVWSYASLAASALAGKMDEAKAALAEALRLEPKLTIKFMTLFGPPVPNLFDGLRKVGLAEEAQVEPAHLSIVVLPFTNLSSDPNQDYFADGITENLTTELSRIRNSIVIARNTAFTYKGETRRQGDRQGAWGALRTGRLGAARPEPRACQRPARRRRIRRASLGRPVRGGHGRPVQAARSSRGAIGPQPSVSFDQGRSRKRLSFQKSGRNRSDHARLGLADSSFNQPPEQRRDMIYQARALFERALKIDPNDADALAGSAVTYFVDFIYGWGDPGTDYDAKILGPADRAIALAPDDPNVYFAKGEYLGLSRRSSEALGAADAGLAINPNFVRPLSSARQRRKFPRPIRAGEGRLDGRCG